MFFLLFDGHRGLGLRPIATLLCFGLIPQLFAAILMLFITSRVPSDSTDRQAYSDKKQCSRLQCTITNTINVKYRPHLRRSAYSYVHSSYTR